jgi:hypothetical protein
MKSKNICSSLLTLTVLLAVEAPIFGQTFKAEMTFQVDMNPQIAAGTFNTTTDQVYVRGNYTGWEDPPAQGLLLQADPARPGVYTGTKPIELIDVGDPIEYRYTFWRPSNNAITWENGANHIIYFTGNEPDADGDTYREVFIPLTYFGNQPFGSILQQDTLVTFRADMTGAVATGGVPFNPATQGVWLNGNFANWWAWGTKPVIYQMFDDGTHGDQTAGDRIYSLQLTIPKGTNQRLDYKYGIESQDNESTFQNNHVRYINAQGSFLMPVDVFGNMQAENPPLPGNVSISASGGNITVQWGGGAGIILQRAIDLNQPDWQAIPGSESANSMSFPASGGSSFFRAAKL